MRVLKFRQWLGNKFRYWGVNVDGCTFVGPCSGGGINASTTPHQQFTGLFDRNGQEIYEGDIVIAKSYPFYGDDPCEKELNYVGEVFWDDEGLRWCYELHRVSDRVRGAACGDALYIWKHEATTDSGWEVIGNIYEYPYLLEAK